MFIGEHHHTIDEKGRLALPARFRAAFADGAVVTRGLDGCLFVYTKDQWAVLAEKLVNLPLSQSDARKFARLMLAGAFDVELDKQGRINIPATLRGFADLTSNVVVAGLMDRLEIWNVTGWTKQQTEAGAHSEEIVGNLLDFGI